MKNSNKIQLPRKGCNVSICLCSNSKINKLEEQHRPLQSKDVNRLMPIQTVNYETSESQKGIPMKTLIKTYLAYLLYLSG